MLLFKDLINELLSQKNSVLYPVVLTVHSILAAVNRIDLSGTPCTYKVSGAIQNWLGVSYVVWWSRPISNLL